MVVWKIELRNARPRRPASFRQILINSSLALQGPRVGSSLEHWQVCVHGSCKIARRLEKHNRYILDEQTLYQYSCRPCRLCSSRTLERIQVKLGCHRKICPECLHKINWRSRRSGRHPRDVQRPLLFGFVLHLFACSGSGPNSSSGFCLT